MISPQQEKDHMTTNVSGMLAVQVLRNNKLTLVGTFTDDHILCATVQLGELQVDFCWIDWEGCAALMYMEDSEKAREEVAKLVRCQIIATAGVLVEALEDEEDETVDIEEYEEGLTVRRSVYGLDGYSITELQAIAGEEC